MSANVKRIVGLLLLLGALEFGVACRFAESSTASFDIFSFESYRDIPGITDEEISAIEALKSARRRFSYGNTFTAGALVLPGGSYYGFSAEFRELLSNLFGIPFAQVFHDWEELEAGIDNWDVDFTDEINPTPEHRQSYFMTSPIAERALTVFVVKDRALGNVSEHGLGAVKIGIFSGVKIGWYAGEIFPNLTYEIVRVDNAREAAEKLASGEIDAFVIDALDTYIFRDYDFIKVLNAIPPKYTPVSLCTANPDLEPVISVMNKYLQAGGMDKFHSLFQSVKHEFEMYELSRSFTDEEKAFLDNLVSSGAKVAVAFETDNYPISFYDEKLEAFDGIAPDILEEISRLSGIEFEIVTDKNTTWAEILEKLRTGEASLVSQLFITEERKGDFLWPSAPYYSSNFALLSKSDYPDLELHQVIQSTVGAVTGVAPEEMYRVLFPGDTKLRRYDTHDEALDALERGEIDLFMASDYSLLYQTNYREKTGYKINISFDALKEESFFGFNNNEEILCSIISKAQDFVNSEKIVQDRIRRVYDYSKKMTEERYTDLITFAIILALFLIILIILLIVNNKMRWLYKDRMLTLSTIYKSSPDLMFCKDINSRYTSCSRSFEEFAARSESELIGKTAVEVFAFSEMTSDDIKEDEKKVLNEKITVKSKVWLTYPDQSRGFFESVKAPLIRNGKVIGLLGMMRDITELKEAMEAADKEHDRTRIVLSNYPGIIWLADNAGAVTLIDGMYLKNFKSRSDAMPDENTGGVLDEGLYSQINTFTKKALTGEVQEVFVKTQDSVFHGHTTPFYDDGGNIAGVVGSIEDVAELILLQENLEIAVKEAHDANKAKSDFLAHMSHEIRTPMNAIMGMTELALREEDSEVLREHILTIKQAGANLLSIINDILDFSKIESGVLKIFQERYLFSSLVNDVIGIIRVRTIDTKIRFAVNIDCNIPNALIGDELRIRQVLVNLLGNAVKYTEKGFVSFTVNGVLIGEDAISLTMEVKDSGKGIKREDIDLLFEKYTQLDLDRNRGIEGVGLGLSITRNLVKAMGGEITVSSEYGKGSRFTVTLPQKIHSHEKLATVINPDKKKVLIYERREIYADSLSSAVDNLGVYCIVVSSDSELHETMSADTFSFIFVSYGLYEKNKDKILEFAADAQIVLLADFSEQIGEKGTKVLAMPAYSLSIANILNGVSEGFTYRESKESVAMFAAPDARVLVVDDINTNLIVTNGLLTPYGMQVDLCRSGAEAIAAVKSTRYDLVFMDHRMPGMDGVEATAHIRALGAEDHYYGNLPIIALTANAISGVREMFIESGFNDFMSKPIDTVVLNTVLGKWIPKEKRKVLKAETGGSGAAEERKADIPFRIKGVDVEKGIAFTGGTIKYYLETLATFYQDALERKNIIAESLENGNLPMYVTSIHALKSAAANIGADRLSEIAKTLEMAGEQEDFAFIEAYNGKFLASLESLLGVLKEFIPKREENKYGENRFFDREACKSELIKLKIALDDMEAGVINRTVGVLEKMPCSEETAAAIRTISENILVGDYEGAAALVESLLQEAQR